MSAESNLAGAGKRTAMVSIAVSAALAILKITVGLKANSTATVSDGFESASDVLASGIVLTGLIIASRPPDHDHPYGHGRFEILSALFVGAILSATGALLCFHAIQRALEPPHAPEFFAVWPLLISIACKAILWSLKRRYGRRMRSEALLADATNDAVDVLSAVIALLGLSIALRDPRLGAFDHIGGFCVGLIVVALGLRVMRDTALQLTDTMPDERMLDEIRGAALQVPGALAIEKCLARKTGMKYHVDMHLEVDPNLTVQASHEIATQVRIVIKESLDWVADVLVHVEPYH
jgi:cation diffusion facilitator family transporter